MSEVTRAGRAIHIAVEIASSRMSARTATSRLWLSAYSIPEADVKAFGER